MQKQDIQRLVEDKKSLARLLTENSLRVQINSIIADEKEPDAAAEQITNLIAAQRKSGCPLEPQKLQEISDKATLKTNFMVKRAFDQTNDDYINMVKQNVRLDMKDINSYYVDALSGDSRAESELIRSMYAFHQKLSACVDRYGAPIFGGVERAKINNDLEGCLADTYLSVAYESECTDLASKAALIKAVQTRNIRLPIPGVDKNEFVYIDPNKSLSDEQVVGIVNNLASRYELDTTREIDNLTSKYVMDVAEKRANPVAYSEAYCDLINEGYDACFDFLVRSLPTAQAYNKGIKRFVENTGVLPSNLVNDLNNSYTDPERFHGFVPIIDDLIESVPGRVRMRTTDNEVTARTCFANSLRKKGVPYEEIVNRLNALECGRTEATETQRNTLFDNFDQSIIFNTRNKGLNFVLNGDDPTSTAEFLSIARQAYLNDVETAYMDTGDLEAAKDYATLRMYKDYCETYCDGSGGRVAYRPPEMYYGDMCAPRVRSFLQTHLVVGADGQRIEDLDHLKFVQTSSGSAPKYDIYDTSMLWDCPVNVVNDDDTLQQFVLDNELMDGINSIKSMQFLGVMKNLNILKLSRDNMRHQKNLGVINYGENGGK